MQGDVAVNFSDSEYLGLNTVWHGTDETPKVVGTGDFQETIKLTALLLTADQFGNERLNVTLRSQTATVEAKVQFERIYRG